MVILLNVSPSSSSFAFLSSTKALQTRTDKPLLCLKNKAFSIISLHSTSYNSPSAPEVDTFWEWLCEHGVVSADSPVRPATVNEGLGLVAQRDIAENEVVLEIPKKLWITPDAVAASEIGNACSELKPLIAMALFLAREKKREDSRWRVYLDIIPKYTDSTLFWSEEQLLQLRGTQLLSKTIDVKEYVQNEFLKLEEEIILPNKELFPYPITLDDFSWAFGMVRSRAFEILLPGKEPFPYPFPVTLDDLSGAFDMVRSRAFSRPCEHNLVVIPLADLINHSSKITTEDYAEIRGTGPFFRDHLFSLWTPVAVKAGEQVFIQYDLDKSNAKLALNYGFTESKSDRNAYTLKFQISKSDLFFDDKVKIAQSIGLSETADFDIVLDHPLPPTMLPYLRLAALGETDAFLFDSSLRSTILSHLDSPVNPANEMLVCQAVRDACKTALCGYHTTIEEDEKLLEGESIDLRLRIAVEIRAGEKKVLQQIDGIFKDRELKLDELEYYQGRRPHYYTTTR